MAVNLAAKYSDKIAAKFTCESYLKGRTSGDFDFDGVKGIKIYTPVTVPLNDFQRGGVSRYGTPQEMQDTVQSLLMTQDKSFTLTIDKGNNSEQVMVKNAGRMLNLQIQEQCVPVFDRYAFSRYIRDAGCVLGVESKPTKANIVEIISRAVQKLDDQCAPQSDRTLFATSEMVSLIRLSPEYSGVESLSREALSKGAVGEIMGASVVKVPVSYLPADCYLLLCHKKSVLFPVKIQDAKVHRDPPGFSGALLEGRFLYDAFVVGACSGGICAVVLSSQKQAAPALGGTAPSFTLLSAGAEEIRYTADGTDPRYSESAKIYTGAVTLAESATVKAVAYAEGKFTSDVTEGAVAAA